MDETTTYAGFKTARARLHVHRSSCDLCEVAIKARSLTFPPCPIGMSIMRQFLKAIWLLRYYKLYVPDLYITPDLESSMEAVIFDRMMVGNNWS